MVNSCRSCVPINLNSTCRPIDGVVLNGIVAGADTGQINAKRLVNRTTVQGRRRRHGDRIAFLHITDQIAAGIGADDDRGFRGGAAHGNRVVFDDIVVAVLLNDDGPIGIVGKRIPVDGGTAGTGEKQTDIVVTDCVRTVYCGSRGGFIKIDSDIFIRNGGTRNGIAADSTQSISQVKADIVGVGAVEGVVAGREVHDMGAVHPPGADPGNRVVGNGIAVEGQVRGSEDADPGIAHPGIVGGTPDCTVGSKIIDGGGVKTVTGSIADIAEEYSGKVPVGIGALAVGIHGEALDFHVQGRPVAVSGDHVIPGDAVVGDGAPTTGRRLDGGGFPSSDKA